MSGDTGTEEWLRSALSHVAETVEESPDAYHEAKRHWQRRDMKRRAVMVALVLVLVALACVAGVWALSGASPAQHVIFHGLGAGHGSVTTVAAYDSPAP
ncbi:hypothetical protein [Streptomyces rubradiris]|uniref:Uncharacterized protein n=1 Tax=Streptomyces rubradiris TaxID=285531 RepID=A0ABQ3REY1_STRRR|nr:hypothetical protein [Streptomyces rubradiris]GHG97555.1 hypothetical protein GCM10018792_09490 [Streptomyces rubradiris]GHI54433.1 hypothetical protein Srubr_42790 [Streptomyces rubradiris]